MPDMVYFDLRNLLMLAEVCVLGEKANSGSTNFSRHDVDVGISVALPVIVVKISTPHRHRALLEYM